LGTISMRGERENETRPGLKAGVSERACRWNPCRILQYSCRRIRLKTVAPSIICSKARDNLGL